MNSEYTGLRNIREIGHNSVFCPKCGNYLYVVDNGFFHGELFYCEKENLVFKLTLKDITNKSGEEFIAQSKKDIELRKLKGLINLENMEKVRELIK